MPGGMRREPHSRRPPGATTTDQASTDLSWKDYYTTEEITRVLRDHARQGMSHSEMATAVGHGITRDVVSGLCRRARPRIRTHGRQAPAPAPAIRGRTPRFVIVDEIEVEKIHLMDLRQRSIKQCRAPLWPHRLHTRIKVKPKTEAHFCGRATIPGSSYCAEHHDEFLTKPEKKPSPANSDRAKAGHKMRRLEREVAGE